MKPAGKKEVVTAFREFFPPPWRRIGSKYLRVEGDWVQMVVFYASKWDRRHQPRSCFEFLKDPEDATGTFLVSTLDSHTGVQLWVTPKEVAKSPSTVFNDMAAQFKPSLLAPLELKDIKRLLESEMDYWPHAYALCVMAAEAGIKTKARRYLAAFEAEVANKPRDWFAKPRRELNAHLKDIGTPALRKRLAKIKADKLRALKLTP